MHTYHLVHAGTQISVASKDVGVAVNTRADFPYYALDFCGERSAKDVVQLVDSGRGFLTTFFGDCHFYRAGRRYLANYLYKPHTCFLAYAQETCVFAVLDGQGWPVTTTLAENDNQLVPKYAMAERNSNVVSLFR